MVIIEKIHDHSYTRALCFANVSTMLTSEVARLKNAANFAGSDETRRTMRNGKYRVCDAKSRVPRALWAADFYVNRAAFLDRGSYTTRKSSFDTAWRAYA